MKKYLTIVVALVMVLSLVACGGNNGNSTVSVEDVPVAETGAPNIEEVAVGNKIVTDFVEISVLEAGVEDSLRTSIKTGNFTRTFGPESSSETEYVYIKGKIMNKATSSLGNGIVAIAKVGDYKLEEDDLYIYKADGDTVWELSPLVEYNFMMSVEVPNALVESMETCDLTFGFNEDMESSFVEFEELAYKYSLKVTPKAEEPATAEVE